ncbi:MAG: nicotinate-nucleotide adenylyltransferase [Firmicutes bacterium]|nr:nicotinate-nucleotide adenylyltransferase [Bacillota bacterium]
MGGIGILGGTFDPIHYGHLFIAQNAMHFFRLEKVLFVPTGISPHKPQCDVLDKKHRFNMARLATQCNNRFEVSDIECSKTAVSYTVNTVSELKMRYPDKNLFYITGTDSLYELTSWRNFAQLAKMVEIISVNRISDEMVAVDEIAASLSNEYGAKIHILKAPIIEISSTEIRRRVKNGLPIKYMLPDSVLNYIEQNTLYKGIVGYGL